MLTINYESWVLGPTAKHLIYIKAQGTTPGEVETDAERQRKAINAVDMQAVGIHNSEADWIAVFGNNYDTNCVFGGSHSMENHPKKITLKEHIKNLFSKKN